MDLGCLHGGFLGWSVLMLSTYSVFDCLFYKFQKHITRPELTQVVSSEVIAFDDTTKAYLGVTDVLQPEYCITRKAIPGN